MKKLIFVGQVNILIEEINHYLSDFFDVQVYEGKSLLDGGLLGDGKPDVILLSLLGMNEEKADIFRRLRVLYGDVPLMCLQASEHDVTPDMLEGISKSKCIMLPEENEKIMEEICELLGCRYDKESRVILEDFHKKKCVLAIDDNSLQLRMLNEILKADYDVMMANSAIKALTMIGKRVPDIILLDYDMPLCDGKMAMQMIREIEETKHVPIIFLTAVKDAAHIKAVLELHPAGYLLKPAKRDTIREEIEKHIK